jgi:UDP-N-acetylglucosamine acyltransferase
MISPLASIGAPGQDKRRPDPPNHGVTIGDGVTVREFAVIHGGFTQPTVIGPGCYVMCQAHVGHDARLDDDVIVCAGAVVGGHNIVHRGANIGVGAVLHQHVTVGAYAMVGQGSVVIRDVPPFAVVVGNPAQIIKTNRIGMERAGFTGEQIHDIEYGKRTEWHDLFDREAGRR